jgi:hypothetical protein
LREHRYLQKGILKNRIETVLCFLFIVGKSQGIRTLSRRDFIHDL